MYLTVAFFGRTKTSYKNLIFAYLTHRKVFFRVIDTARILQSDYRSTEAVKQKRKTTRREKNKLADAFQKTNDYKSAAFYQVKQNQTGKRKRKKKKTI